MLLPILLCHRIGVTTALHHVITLVVRLMRLARRDEACWRQYSRASRRETERGLAHGLRLPQRAAEHRQQVTRGRGAARAGRLDWAVDHCLYPANHSLEVGDVFLRCRSVGVHGVVGIHEALSRSTGHVARRLVRCARTRPATKEGCAVADDAPRWRCTSPRGEGGLASEGTGDGGWLPGRLSHSTSEGRSHSTTPARRRLWRIAFPRVLCVLACPRASCNRPDEEPS